MYPHRYRLELEPKAYPKIEKEKIEKEKIEKEKIEKEKE
jgi:hypothetical protein